MLDCVEVRAFADTNHNYVLSAARPRDREIEMVMVAAARVEGGIAGGADGVAFKVGGDRQLGAAGAAEDGWGVPFGLGPDFDGVGGEGGVAVFAGEVGGAALHFDGDDVGGTVVVKAAGLGIEV
jgi:hypothetical protein